MTKSYADSCIEIASHATEGPWVFDTDCDVFAGKQDESGEFEKRVCTMPYSADYHADLKFIAHSRTDVVELARRLKKACEELRLSCITFRRCGQYDEAILNERIANELEAMPER